LHGKTKVSRLTRQAVKWLEKNKESLKAVDCKYSLEPLGNIEEPKEKTREKMKEVLK